MSWFYSISPKFFFKKPLFNLEGFILISNKVIETLNFLTWEKITWYRQNCFSEELVTIPFRHSENDSFVKVSYRAKIYIFKLKNRVPTRPVFPVFPVFWGKNRNCPVLSCILLICPVLSCFWDVLLLAVLMFILLEYFNFDDKKKLLKQARFSQFRHFKTQNFFARPPQPWWGLLRHWIWHP